MEPNPSQVCEHMQARMEAARLQYHAALQTSIKLSDFIAGTGNCPFEEFGGWKDCQDTECQQLKGAQPAEKSAWCWRRWGGCPTCNKGFGAQQTAQAT
jgi:hypothetical protein